MFGAIVAQTPTVPVRIVNQSGPSWVEIAGVVATFLAVLVALFGRQLYESRRRPKLTLSPYPETYTTTVGLDSVPMNLKLHNERGKTRRAMWRCSSPSKVFRRRGLRGGRRPAIST
jgi:hypothetical protein